MFGWLILVFIELIITVQFIRTFNSEFTDHIYLIHYIIIFGVIGLSYLAYEDIQKNILLYRKGIKTSGKIESFFKGKDAENYTTFYPIIRFKTTEGKEIHFTSSLGHRNTNKKHSIIEIIYHPDFPEFAEINNFFLPWIKPAFLLLICVLLIFLLISV